MPLGLDTWKDVLDVVIVPIVLGLVALLWPSIQLRARRRTFQRLISREIQELGPYPQDATRGSRWTNHLQRDFVHRRIFRDVSENRDFILSLPAATVYNVFQLWGAFDHEDARQWLYYLNELNASKSLKSGELDKVAKEWAHVIRSYELLATGQYDL